MQENAEATSEIHNGLYLIKNYKTHKKEGKCNSQEERNQSKTMLEMILMTKPESKNMKRVLLTRFHRFKKIQGRESMLRSMEKYFRNLD
jgi:hypothetical protein